MRSPTRDLVFFKKLLGVEDDDFSSSGVYIARFEYGGERIINDLPIHRHPGGDGGVGWGLSFQGEIGSGAYA